ncbi:MAG: hypothetical protein EBQ99_05490 [Planctomycetes bacterium]|nr:hypothetical protein [Planctomycetota bacterium]
MSEPARHDRIDRLTAWIERHAWTIIVGTVALAAASGFLSWRHLGLDADTNSLIGEHQPFMADYGAFRRDFGDLEFLLVVVDPKGRPDDADDAVRALAQGLRAAPGLPEVMDAITPQEQFRLAPWAAPDRDLAGLALAAGALPVMAAGPGAGGLLLASAERIESLADRGGDMEDPVRRRMAAEAFLLARSSLGGMPEAPTSPGSPRKDEWLLAEGGRLRLLLIRPEKDYGTLAVVERPLGEIRRVIDAVRRRYPAVEIGLTGKPVLQADEMASTERDMQWASVTGLSLCAALFMAVFRGVKRPLLAVGAFAAAAAMTSAAAAVLVGRLNLLSVVFMLVLVGVGLDYGIHMVARYLEGLRHLGPEASVRHMMRKALPSMLAGAATSAGTFLLALLVPMQGLRELGLISGVGLLLSAAVMAVTLPALLLRLDRNATRRPLGRGLFEEPLDRRLDPLGGRAGARHQALVVVALVAAVAGGWMAWTRGRFESNLLKLQASGLESVAWQRRLQAEGANATWFGASIADHPATLQARAARAAQEPLIGRCRSVLDIVPEMDSPSRMAWRREIASAPPVAAGPRQIATPELAARAAKAMDRLAGLASLASAPAEDVRGIETLGRQLAGLAAALRERPDETVRAAEQAADRSAGAATAMREGAAGSLRQALPAAVRDTFTSEGGRYALLMHPAEDVWEADAMNRFVEAMRRVDPAVTGVPITVSESMRLMERSFLVQAALATALVTLLLLVDLRSLQRTLLVLVSLAVGMLVSVGVLAWLDVPFNLANFFAIPIMIGLAVDSSIHVTHRAVDGGLASGFGSTRRAVVVTALTTTIGFGTLMWAEHRGLRSLGQVMVVASLCCLASSVWLLPAMLRVAGLGRVPPRAPSMPA